MKNGINFQNYSEASEFKMKLIQSFLRDVVTETSPHAVSDNM